MLSTFKSPWLVCLLPFVVYMLVGSLEPAAPAEDDHEHVSEPYIDLGIEYRHYPIIYTAKIGLTLLAMALVWPGYREYEGRPGRLAVVVGISGAVLWVGLSHWQHWTISQSDFGWVRSLGARSAFNPLEQMSDQPLLAYGFLAIRFLGLVLVVPVIEEFFLRGFLMRYVMEERWWEVRFGDVNPLALVVGTAVPMMMHPQEALAALFWFSLITWLMVRTRSIWSCIAAHAITNLLMGLYVLASGQWWLM